MSQHRLRQRRKNQWLGELALLFPPGVDRFNRLPYIVPGLPASMLVEFIKISDVEKCVSGRGPLGFKANPLAGDRLDFINYITQRDGIFNSSAHVVELTR